MPFLKIIPEDVEVNLLYNKLIPPRLKETPVCEAVLVKLKSELKVNLTPKASISLKLISFVKFFLASLPEDIFNVMLSDNSLYPKPLPSTYSLVAGSEGVEGEGREGFQKHFQKYYLQIQFYVL